MHYRKFIIHEYRGIQEPVTFDLEKDSIFPLVGVNECGKTTLLEALLSFDDTADKQNGGRHLKDVENLYSLKTGAPRVSAIVQISKDEFTEYLNELMRPVGYKDWKTLGVVCSTISEQKMSLDELISTFSEEVDNFIEEYERKLRKSRKDESVAPPDPVDMEPVKELRVRVRENEKISEIISQLEHTPLESIEITRTLTGSGMTYTLSSPFQIQSRLQNRLAKAIVRNLDFILYFDDFRHDVPARIRVAKDPKCEWTDILDTLFRKAHPDLDFFALPELDSRRRQTVISKAEKHLNKTLTDQWERFHLEDRKSLDIHLKYHDSSNPEIEFEIMERNEDDDCFFFGIKDRSKGFFWFFNFVMRLEFNPKMSEGGRNIMYLLDEPGSYLHSRAQDQLCGKLMDLSRENKVFYCTHSHHLLDPNVIPFSSIRIVEKDKDKQIAVKTVFDRNSDRRVDAAFQPIFEALQVKPAALDIDKKRVLVVEGLYDFLSFNMLKPSDELAIVPAVNANSIKYHLSWLMAWGVDYRALWDNDKAGREKYKEAESYFGENEALNHYRLLPLENNKSKRRLEDLFAKEDLEMMRLESDLPKNAKFNKAIMATYYSARRQEILSKISLETRSRFNAVFQSLWDDIEARV